MITKLIVSLLMFIAIGCIAYQIVPSLYNFYSRIQDKRMEYAARNLSKLFVFSKKRHLRTVFIIVPLASALLGFLVSSNILGAVIGFAIGFMLPTMIIRIMASGRKMKFHKQIIDGMMILSSSLKAGMSLTQGFEVLVEELPPPLSEEFALVVRENHMGVPLDECLNHLRERMPLDDLTLIVTAISISRETGGDLTEIFSHLVRSIREKRKLENRVKALTIQGKMQGFIMSALPIVFAIFLYKINPGGFQVMLNDDMGKMLLVWAGISEVIGIILILKLSKVTF